MAHENASLRYGQVFSLTDRYCKVMNLKNHTSENKKQRVRKWVPE
jgi:hypothetical protein